MSTTAGTRKRIPLGKYSTYAAAKAARDREDRYPVENLQIRKRKNGSEFQLVARTSTIVNSNSKQENQNNG